MGTWRVYMIFHVKIFFCSFITQKNVGVYDLQCLYFSKNFTNACKSAKSIGHFLKSAPDIVYNQLDTNFSLPRESFCESTCGIVDIVIYGSFSCQGSILFILMWHSGDYSQSVAGGQYKRMSHGRSLRTSISFELVRLNLWIEIKETLLM